MQIGLDIASISVGAVAAVLWFLSASVRLTKIGFGQDELDKVTRLSDNLQDMARWNYWAAGCTALAVLFQVAAKLAQFFPTAPPH